MTLQSSGSISLSQIASEFGDSAPNSMSEFYRGGGKVPDTSTNSNISTSGSISIGNFYGATSRIAVNITIGSNTQNFDVYSNKGGSYVSGISDIIVTISSGIIVGSSSTSSYAMIISGFTTGDTVTIINNGYIVGMGGTGGGGISPIYSVGNGGGGGAGNTAGSGGAAGAVLSIAGNAGSLTSGGSATLSTNTSGPPTNNAGGGNNGFPGGPALQISFPTTIYNNGIIGGGGGGGGQGGWHFQYSSPFPPVATHFAGGAGGNLGNAGIDGTTSGYGFGTGGAAGAAVVGNSYITWSTYGTVYGTVS